MRDPGLLSAREAPFAIAQLKRVALGPIGPAVVALFVALVYLAYLSPGRLEVHFDQYDYLELASVLADDGVFGRHADGTIVPEPRRTFGYPLFLAAIVKLVGDPYPTVAFVQIVLIATLPMFVHGFVRAFASARAATAGAYLCALFAPLAYWSAYVMTETLTTFLLTAGVVMLYRVVRRPAFPAAATAGVLLGYAGSVRPTWAFVALALGAVLIALRVIRATDSRSWTIAAAIGIAMLAGAVPVTAYTYLNFGTVGPAPFKPGLQILLGYWQGVWPGRLNAVLEELAREHAPDSEIARTAREFGIDPERASRFVYEIRTYGERPDVGPYTFVAANAWAFDRAREDIAADPIGFVTRGFTVRLPILLAGSVPLRYEQVNATPRAVLLVMWSLQASLVALAAIGLLHLWRRSRDARLAAALVVALVLYVSVTHFPFWVDPRYALPVQPLLLGMSAVGAGGAARVIAGACRGVVRRPKATSEPLVRYQRPRLLLERAIGQPDEGGPHVPIQRGLVVPGGPWGAPGH